MAASSTSIAATTGIIDASVVTTGLLATPALMRKGYQKEMTSGIICAADTLGILIPPSIMMVIYGGLTGLKETTVGNLLVGSGLNRRVSLIIMMHIYRGIMPFVALQVLGLIVLTLFPALTTWLPKIFFGQ